jgi:hypothetical protein
MPVVKTLLATVLVLASALGLGALPVGAQSDTAQTDAAQSNESPGGPAISVDLGLGGYTSPDLPSGVAVTVSSQVLISGRVRLTGSGISVSRPIEVPAGSEQRYDLTVPPLTDGTRLTVEVLANDGDSLARESVTVRHPGKSELVVGVLGAPDLVDTLGRIRTVVTGRPVAAFAVPTDVSPSQLEVLDYLVVGRGGEEGLAAALDWAGAGGAVVVDASLATEVTDTVPMGVQGVSRSRDGAGTVIVVESLLSRSDADWSEILRPVPLDLAHTPEWQFQDPTALLRAASEAGSRQVPEIPWLLAAILAFAVVVGPVNFIVLSKIKKRDWAWVTIPALSVLAVVGFWVAGRQRIAGTNLTHASVVTDDGSVVARSAVMVAAGVAGERRLTFDGGTVFPEPSLFGSATTELRLEGEGAATLELDQLGFTGVGLLTSDPGFELPRVRVAEGQLTVENGSPLDFWGWGAIAHGGSTVAGGDLAAGSSGSVPVPRAGADFGMTFIDNLMNRHQLWEDPARANSLWPLSEVLWTKTDSDSVYFVGLTDDYRPGVSVADGPADLSGPTLVLIEAGMVDSGSATSAPASVVGVGFINWLDWGVQRVVSTDQMTVRFRLPDPQLSVRLVNEHRFGMAPAAYEAWNWEAAAFEPFEIQNPLPPQAVSPDGEVYVRLVGQNEFGDNPMSPNDLSLVWEAS